MTRSSISRARVAVVAVLSVVLIAAVTALAALAAPPPGKGKGTANGKAKGTVAAAQYQYGPGGKQYGKTKVTICHKGKTIKVAQPAVRAHLRNHQGDHLGAC